MNRENIVGTKEYFYKKYGKETVNEWIDCVEMEDLFNCMDAFSNASFIDFNHEYKAHRDKQLNILEMILQECPNALYPSVTSGVRPNEICTDAIGDLTGRKYGNIEIAIFLIQENIKELKKWLLRDYCFSHKELELLHFFKNRKGVFIDELDTYYDDVDRYDIESWFNNKYAKKQYVVVGKSERYDVKGENARGHINKIFNSILEAIDGCTDGCGICYMKIYENNRGKLFVDIIHHDGHNSLEIRELTQKGEKTFYNADLYKEEDVITRIANINGYTKNVHFSKNYY